MYSHKTKPEESFAKISFFTGCLIQIYPNIYIYITYSNRHTIQNIRMTHKIPVWYIYTFGWTFMVNHTWIQWVIYLLNQSHIFPVAPSGWSASLAPDPKNAVLFNPLYIYIYLWSTNITPKSLDQYFLKSNQWLVVARSLLRVAGRV